MSEDLSRERDWAEAEVAAPSRALGVFLGLVLLLLLLGALLLLT